MIMNKFNFIDTKNENNDVNINNVYLSANNPRYTLINDLDINLIEFINNNKYKNTEDNFRNLLNSEGDYNELSRLLNSINKNGFNNINEPIYLVKNKSDYIVAEGNRRLMCLKLINGDFDLPHLPNYEFQNYQNPLTEYSDDIEEDSNNEKNNLKKLIENLDLCHHLLNEIKKKDINFNVYFTITKNESELWNQIYDRHLTGNRPGMRQWSRSKYFADLLSIFKRGLSDENEINITNKFNREWKMIKRDFFEAQYIYSCLFFNYISTDFEKPDFKNLENDILEKMIHSNKISALEKIHSLNKIKELICIDILMVNDTKIFKENFLDITYSSTNHRIEFIPKNNFEYQKLLSWIVDKWKNGDITTRSFKPKIKEKLINELKYNILSNIDFDNHLSIEQLNELNEFDLSIEQLDKVISANYGYYSNEEIYRFNKAKNIKLEINNFIENIKINRIFQDIEPIKVFYILQKQLEHNNENRHFYLNAICCTLRSLLEQIFRWLTFSYISTNKNEEKKEDFIKKVANGTCFYKYGKINGIEINDRLLQKSLDLCLKNNSKSAHYKIELMKLIDHNDESNFKWLLDENIHAIHRIYISKEYNNRLDEIEKNGKLILNLIQDINFNNSYFNELNEKIIDYIRVNNK